ncbi:MAG: OadG family protein [Lachnospiraceae bacterium]|nr:OadG family protein [Lachnospiraceae bacterium]
MKMKKIVLMFSMIAVLFTMTGCSDGQEHVDFEYSETSIISDTILQSYELQNVNDAYRALLANSEEEDAEILLTAVNNFDTAVDECGTFVGYRLTDGTDMKVDFNTMDNETYNVLLANVESTVEENGNTVVVNVTAIHEKCDVIYTFVYERNPEADYMYQLYQQQVSNYKIKEVTVAQDYSLAEKMEKAAYNTLMGMGTVFIVLIFISVIIAQFEKLNKISTAFSAWWDNLKNKKTAEEAVEDVATPVTVASVAASAPMDDSQLVAVITAAVVAASTANGGTDKLIVRSIRKAKR